MHPTLLLLAIFASPIEEPFRNAEPAWKEIRLPMQESFQPPSLPKSALHNVSNYYTNVEFSNKNTAASVKLWSSTLTVENSIFSGCSSFGSMTYDQTGGSIFCQSCEIYIKNSTFSGNSARFGGSLSFFKCQLLIDSSASPTVFQNDLAFDEGGSIFFVGIVDINETSIQHPDAMIISVSFKNCTSIGACGAASFTRVRDLYLQDISITKCQASFFGGGFGISDSNAMLLRCNFSDNSCNLWNNSVNYHQSNVERLIGRGRGGGAIYIYNEGDLYLPYLITQQCLFCGNDYSNENGLDVYGDFRQNIGYDIMFFGNSVYRSYIDSFGQDANISIGEFTRNTISNSSYSYNIVFYQSTFENGSVCNYNSTYNQVYSSLVNPTPMSDIEGTYATPEPTPSAFILMTTPITKLPYATTRSRIFVPSSGTPIAFVVTQSRFSTPTPSPSRSPSPSPSPSPIVLYSYQSYTVSKSASISQSRTVISQASYTAEDSLTGSYTVTNTENTESATLVQSYTKTVTAVVVYTISMVNINVFTFVFVQTQYFIYSGEVTTASAATLSGGLIIALSVGVALILFISAGIVIFIVRRAKGDEDISSTEEVSDEMENRARTTLTEETMDNTITTIQQSTKRGDADDLWL